MKPLPNIFNPPIFKFEKEKIKRIVWDEDKISRIIFMDKLKSHPSFNRCFNSYYDMSETLVKDYRKVIDTNKGENHRAVEITGIQGSGKSRVVQAIVRKVYGLDYSSGTSKSLCMDNISFTYDKTLDIAQKLKRKTYIIQDEQPLRLGAGSEREILEIQNLIETTRINGINFFFVSPTSRKHDNIHYRLEIIQRSSSERLTKLAVLHPRIDNLYLGYIIVSIPEDEEDEFYTKEYLPTKKAFVNNQIINRQLDLRIDFNKTAEELTKHPEFYKCIFNRDALTTLSETLYPNWTTNEHRKNVGRALSLDHVRAKLTELRQNRRKELKPVANKEKYKHVCDNCKNTTVSINPTIKDCAVCGSQRITNSRCTE